MFACMLPAGAACRLNLGVGKVTVTNVNGTSGGDGQWRHCREQHGGVAFHRYRFRRRHSSRGMMATSRSIPDPGTSPSATSRRTICRSTPGSGDVRVDGVTASALSVDTGSGDVTVTAASRRALDIDTGSGDIHLGLTGDMSELSVDTGSGDVEVSRAEVAGRHGRDRDQQWRHHDRLPAPGDATRGATVCRGRSGMGRGGFRSIPRRAT